jgi:hypothetical protein
MNRKEPCVGCSDDQYAACMKITLNWIKSLQPKLMAAEEVEAIYQLIMLARNDPNDLVAILTSTEAGMKRAGEKGDTSLVMAFTWKRSLVRDILNMLRKRWGK